MLDLLHRAPAPPLRGRSAGLTSSATDDSQEVHASNDRYEIRLDRERGLICCRTLGLWSVANVDNYFALMRVACGSIRAQHGQVRVLSDGSQSVVQTPEVAARLAILGQLLDERCDRLALVVASSLRRMQMRRVLPGDHAQVFLDRDESIGWLLG